MLKSFRYLLYPFSLLYGLIILIRNWLFDKGIMKSAMFNFPLICVGNLAVGGTGKTPMTEYLMSLLKDKYLTATLSRGYKRKTKGFAIAGPDTTAIDIGDEPMQFHQKFPDVTVAVGEERLVAIPQLLHDRPNTQVIILDDAFQHRSVRAGLNILLTEYNNLYTRDFLMPAGDLRDVVSSRKRADIIVVTKCRIALPDSKKTEITNELKLLPHQSVFFTEIVYGQLFHLFSKEKTSIEPDSDVLLICGIANPRPLKKFIAKNVRTYDMLLYKDHHIFLTDDLREIKKHFDDLASENKIIITTEKDGVRLEKFSSELASYPIYVLPIKHQFLFDEGSAFDKIIFEFIDDILW
ncbi:MAG: tetraacyldisaccharide 4'-kinase [Ferruginibacter sp.]